ncbi:MAG: T9SS type A sorting domain-containing protein, partial [Saprospiraceae bacterium]
AKSLLRDAAVFTVSFTAKADVKLSEVLSFDSRYTAAEAYNADLELMDIELRFNEGTLKSDKLHLYQNRPNPFNVETLIGFDLPVAGTATLNVYDASGMLLIQVEGDYDKGYNNVVISNEKLFAGVFYYELVTDRKTIVKKMIYQN